MSPNQLIPSQPYTLSYFITDHTDSNTYYVRAVVYDAITGDVLDTQNLTRQTSNTRLFSKVAQAPGDPSGHGRRIVVVATAYTDSGYTTKSDLYQEQSENYIVVKAGAGLTLGGGGGVDYYIIREIFAEELKKALEFLGGIPKALIAIGKAIEKIPTKEYELKPLIDGISALGKAIAKIPTDNTVNLSGVTDRLDKAIEILNTDDDKEDEKKDKMEPLIEVVKALIDEVETNHSEMLEKVESVPDKVHTKSNKITFVLNAEEEKPEKIEEKVEQPPRKRVNIKSLL